MEAISIARYVRTSPRRMQEVLVLIRKKNAQRALENLDFLPRRASGIAQKVLQAAIGNLAKKLGRKIEPKDAWVKTALANTGPSMKRIHQGSMGRAMGFRHRTCHITISVSDQP